MNYFRLIFFLKLIIIICGKESTLYKNISFCSYDQYSPKNQIIFACNSHHKISVSNISAFYTTAENKLIFLNRIESQQSNLIKSCDKKRSCNVYYFIRKDFQKISMRASCLEYRFVYSCKYDRKPDEHGYYQNFIFIVIPLFLFISVCLGPM